MERPDIIRVDFVRKYKLGTRCITEIGAVFQYGKVDFGIVGKTKDGKTLRSIQYQWFPKNNLAALTRTG